MLNGLKYVSCPFDSSGYANAARNYLIALSDVGVNVKLKAITFEKKNIGKNAINRNDGINNIDFYKQLTENVINYDTVITHLTPEWYKDHIEKGKLNLSYSVWETSKIFPTWVKWLNSMDGLMVASEWNKRVYIESGITRPIEVVPHAIDYNFFNDTSSPDHLFSFEGKKDFLFYTIGQFTARKNLDGLITAFLNAFAGVDDVGLVIKTFGSSYSSTDRRNTINAVRGIIEQARIGDSGGKIHLILDELTDNDMRNIHQKCNCYISLHRGEGAGIPIMEAMASGNPVIATNYSGCTEFIDSDNSMLVPYNLTPVRGMSWIPWYRGDQFWAEPDIHTAIDMMRYIYKNRGIALEMGENGKNKIANKFSYKRIGDKMVGAIKGFGGLLHE